MKTSEKIKYLRIRKGMTQEELGDLIGVKKAAVNKYETGRVVNIKRSTLQKLADALGVPAAQLLDDPEDNEMMPVAKISKSERELLNLIDSLTPDQKKLIIKMIQELSKEEGR